MESCICSEKQLCCAGFDVMRSGMLSDQKDCMANLAAVQGIGSPGESWLFPEGVLYTGNSDVVLCLYIYNVTFLTFVESEAKHMLRPCLSAALDFK